MERFEQSSSKGKGGIGASNTTSPQKIDARRQAEVKADINGGLTAAQAKAASEVENNIRHDKKESIWVIDEKGNAKNMTSSANESSAQADDIKPDSVITHNHPGALYRTDGIARNIGSSFSTTDITSAIMANAKEIRAVTKGYTFSIRRPKGGWGVSAKEVEEYMDRQYWSQLSANSKYVQASRTDGERAIRADRSKVIVHHKAMQDTAKKFGFIYTRKRTNN